MQITLSQFNRTGVDAFERQMSGGDLLSGESIIKDNQSTINSNVLGTPTGNVVQIQRIKLIPVNTNKNAELFHQESRQTSLGGSSPRRTSAGGHQASQRSSIGAGPAEPSVFLGHSMAAISRFHSTQRSSKKNYQSSVMTSELDS